MIGEGDQGIFGEFLKQIALAPFVHETSLPVAAPAPLLTNDATIGRLQGRIAELEKLLSIHEQTVKVESSRLETISLIRAMAMAPLPTGPVSLITGSNSPTPREPPSMLQRREPSYLQDPIKKRSMHPGGTSTVISS